MLGPVADLCPDILVSEWPTSYSSMHPEVVPTISLGLRRMVYTDDSLSRIYGGG